MHLIYINCTPPCIVCVIVSHEVGKHSLKGRQVKFSIAFPLGTGEHQKYPDHIHGTRPIFEVGFYLGCQKVVMASLNSLLVNNNNSSSMSSLFAFASVSALSPCASFQMKFSSFGIRVLHMAWMVSLCARIALEYDLPSSVRTCSSVLGPRILFSTQVSSRPDD